MPRFERVTYVKEGHYLVGVPARDMDADEWYALSAELRENAMRLGIYAGEGKVSAKKSVAEPADAVVPEIVADAPAEGEG